MILTILVTPQTHRFRSPYLDPYLLACARSTLLQTPRHPHKDTPGNFHANTQSSTQTQTIHDTARSRECRAHDRIGNGRPPPATDLAHGSGRRKLRLELD
jgi:hypothetical protein